MSKFNFLIAGALTISAAFAYGQAPSEQDRNNFTKAVALKYLDIALVSADARVNKELYCETGTYANEITEAALKAIELARSVDDGKATAVQVLNAIQSNKALQEVISTQVSYRFALATPTLGYSIKTIKAALIGSVMYGPAMGALGNISSISFKNASSAELTTVDMDDNGNVITSKKIVAYSVSQNYNYQTIVKIDGKKYRVAQSTEGFLLVPAESSDNDDAYLKGFSEYASECEA